MSTLPCVCFSMCQLLWMLLVGTVLVYPCVCVCAGVCADLCLHAVITVSKMSPACDWQGGVRSNAAKKNSPMISRRAAVCLRRSKTGLSIFALCRHVFRGNTKLAWSAWTRILSHTVIFSITYAHPQSHALDPSRTHAYTHTYIQTHTHVHTHTHTHTHTHARTHTQTCTDVHMHTQIHAHVDTKLRTLTRTHALMHINSKSYIHSLAHTRGHINTEHVPTRFFSCFFFSFSLTHAFFAQPIVGFEVEDDTIFGALNGCL